jgi:thymidylate kinase
MLPRSSSQRWREAMTSSATVTQARRLRTRASAAVSTSTSSGSWTVGRTGERLVGGRRDRIESEGDHFLASVHAGFRRLAAQDPVRWRVVDASGTVDEVAALVRKAVD